MPYLEATLHITKPGVPAASNIMGLLGNLKKEPKFADHGSGGTTNSNNNEMRHLAGRRVDAGGLCGHVTVDLDGIFGISFVGVDPVGALKH